MGPPEYHGYSGPIVLQDRTETPLADAFVKAAEEVGYKALDFNGPNQEGIFQIASSCSTGLTVHLYHIYSGLIYFQSLRLFLKALERITCST